MLPKMSCEFDPVMPKVRVQSLAISVGQVRVWSVTVLLFISAACTPKDGAFAMLTWRLLTPVLS
jgi:hypothetical protein